jgi:alkylated DNA repair dioxygenase AlkB
VLVDRKAPVNRLQLDESSWVDVVERFAPDSGRVFEYLLERARWKQGRSIREGRMVPDPRLGAGLSVEQIRKIPMLHRARLVLEARYRIRLGGVGLVLYRDGRDSVGFHSDDEMLYLERTIVASLCLGARRPIGFKSRHDGTIHDVSLGEGDLYVMGGRCQADWMHGVPKVDEAGPRIAAVWRWTSRTGPPSSSPSHFVPDAPKQRRPK